jgi:hypothetical protein
MDLSSLSARFLASDDQNLQVFKRFYRAAKPEEQRRLYEYVQRVNALEPSCEREQLQFMGDIGCTGDRIIGVQVLCELYEDGLEAKLNPRLLQRAIEAWDKGEEFAPPSQW